MASKQFTKKVYECWALEGKDGLLSCFHGKTTPLLFPGDKFLNYGAYPATTPIRVRVTVERIERKKARK